MNNDIEIKLTTTNCIYDLESFTELLNNVDTSTLYPRKSDELTQLEYKNKTSNVEFSWDKNELNIRGYTNINDIITALKENIFVIS